MTRPLARGRVQRAETYPSLTARRHWRKYATGMATEVIFILGLTAVGLLLAVVSLVVR